MLPVIKSELFTTKKNNKKKKAHKSILDYIKTTILVLITVGQL